MAISGDSGIRDKTIYNLMISSYAKACFENISRIKEEMERRAAGMNFLRELSAITDNSDIKR